jgi:addiction module RelE/StbE family toxin
MNNLNIYYSKVFKEKWDKLSQSVKDVAIEKQKIFKDNPFHPSLRTHPLKGKLKGLWSISVNTQYRIIFQLEGDEVVFISIGKHDIYRSL